jgi:hypothetical protein
MLAYPISYAHRSFAFNQHLDASGAIVAANAQNTVVVDRRRVEPTFRDGRDVLHLARGGTLGRAHKGMTYLSLQGRILAPNNAQAATLADREREMMAAFDPDLCYFDSPSTDGAYAFDFSSPTADTTTYPSGLIPLRWYARPSGFPTMDEVQAEGPVRRWSVGLVAADPRLYEQTEQTLVLTPASATGNVVNRGTVPAPLKATIVMAGAGSSTFTLTRGGVSFILDLSSATAGQTVVVVMETCGPYGRGRYITKAGVESFSLKTSGPATWLDVPSGTTSFVMTNHTNVTSCTLNWRSARA